MQADQLHVFAARFNPLQFQIPDLIYKRWVEHMLDSGVKLTVVECQYGARPFTANISPHLNFIGVRAASASWTKENLIDIGIQRTPEAENICWCDADVFFERKDWAAATVEALQLYRWVQPWSQALDRGPQGEVLNGGKAFVPFAMQYEKGLPLFPDRHGWASYKYGYPHPGYCHASTRRVLEYTGGLFELGGMGASDHAMCLALAGLAARASPPGINPRYVEHLLRWQERAQHAVNGRIGYIAGVIDHQFHGKKANRQYLGRWEMFLRHGFDPDADLKRNSYGVLEWAGNKPELMREWMLYLKSRNEDDNAAE